MNETTLQIIITAVNSAAEQIESVVESLTGISEAAASTSTSASDSMAELADAMSNSATTGIESWESSLSDLDEMMASADATVGEGFATMADDAASSSDEIKSSISSMGGKLQALGIQGEIVGAAFLAPVVDAVQQAADKQSALAQGFNEINNIINSAGSGSSAENATQVADLTAQINAQKASIAEDQAALQKWTGTTAEVGAAHEKAAAGIATAQVNIQKLQNELAPLTSQQNLVGASAQTISNQFSALATQNTNLGISFEDSYNGLVSFFNQTKSTTNATAEYGAAVDLVASGKVPDMTTAVQDVTQAFNGMGRGLQQIIPDMRDGVSGMDAVNQITTALAGSPAVALAQFNTQVAALGTKSQDLAAVMGGPLLSALTEFLEHVNSIIDKLTAWFEAHQKVGEAILIFMGIVGGTLAILSPFLIILGLLTIATEAINTAFLIFGVTLGATIGMVALYVAGFLLFAAIVALVIVYHKQIEAAIEAAWNWIIDKVSDAMLWIYNKAVAWGTDINTWWTNLWNGIWTFLEGIWTKIEGVINSVLSAVSKVTGAVGGIIGGAVSAVGSAAGSILKVNDAIITPSGQVIQTDVADYLFATKNPGAIGGASGAGGITININGGNYLNQGGAQMIAAALATQIRQQLKLSTI